MKLALSVIALAALSTATMAQDVTFESQAEPLESTPELEWDGFYAGLRSNRGKFDTSAQMGDRSFSETGRASTGGFQLGYNVVNDKLLVGGEVSLDRLILNKDEDPHRYLRAVGRVGFVEDKFLIHASAGMSYVHDGDYSDNAPTFGVGLDYAFIPTMTIGMEYTFQQYEITERGVKLESDASFIGLRLNYLY